MNRNRFEDKVVLVTGAGSGIGRAAALAFAAEGARVAVVDTDALHGAETVATIFAQGGQAFFVAADVSKRGDCAAMVAHAVQRYGRLDVAFNNAGISGPHQDGVADASEADWDRVMNINAKGVFLSMKYEIGAMLATGGGVIVNTASVAALVAVRNASAYVAAKHAVLGLTRAAALEYADRNIRVNALCPGGTETAMLDKLKQVDGLWDSMAAAHPIGRIAAPQELAAAALFLASSDASFMVGHALVADGGLTVQ